LISSGDVHGKWTNWEQANRPGKAANLILMETAVYDCLT
jgi:hypothetical protein